MAVITHSRNIAPTFERILTPPPKLTRNQIKHLSALRKKKYRHEQRQFVVEGDTLTAEILSATSSALRYLVCTPDYFDSQTDQWRLANADRVYCCDQQTIASISALDSPTSILALLDMPRMEEKAQPADDLAEISSGLWLYLDGLRDPGNVGTIWRIADWFGVTRLYLSEDCVDLFNPKVIQASMGAFLRVVAQTRELATLRAEHPQLTILGTCINAGSDGLNYAWPAHSLLVIGSESHGIRPAAGELLNAWVSIPRGRHSSGAESLNAGVATGILCAAYLRTFP